MADRIGLMTEHELKCWPVYFSAVLRGDKTFEVRKDDRGFKVGDTLWLREWHPEKGYTGAELRKRVTYALSGTSLGIAMGYIVMGLDQADLRAQLVIETRAALDCNDALAKERTALIAMREQAERNAGLLEVCEDLGVRLEAEQQRHAATQDQLAALRQRYAELEAKLAHTHDLYRSAVEDADELSVTYNRVTEELRQRHAETIHEAFREGWLERGLLPDAGICASGSCEPAWQASAARRGLAEKGEG